MLRFDYFTSKLKKVDRLNLKLKNTNGFGFALDARSIRFHSFRLNSSVSFTSVTP